MNSQIHIPVPRFFVTAAVFVHIGGKIDVESFGVGEFLFGKLDGFRCDAFSLMIGVDVESAEVVFALFEEGIGEPLAVNAVEYRADDLSVSKDGEMAVVLI